MNKLIDHMFNVMDLGGHTVANIIFGIGYIIALPFALLGYLFGVKVKKVDQEDMG